MPAEQPESPAATPAAHRSGRYRRRVTAWVVHFGSPLGISLVLHGVLLMIFATITWVVVQHSNAADDVEFEASIIAEGPTDGRMGGFEFPGQAMLDRPDSAQSGRPNSGSDSLSTLLRREDTRITPDAVGGGAAAAGIGVGDLAGTDIIGVGAGGGAIGSAGVGSGMGDRDAAGGGPVGGLWGVGQGHRAKSVAYVVDRSGSFIEWLEAIDLELKRSLGVLKEDQLFNLIFLRDNKPLAFRPRLVKADDTAKGDAFRWINENPPSGGSDLTPAVKEALRYAPQLVFIVTDQEFLRSVDRPTDMNQLLNMVRTAHKQNKTTVNVILMGAAERPPGDAAQLKRRLERERQALAADAAERLGEQIALLETIEAVQRIPRDTGGSFSYLNGDELMERWRHSTRRP